MHLPTGSLLRVYDDEHPVFEKAVGRRVDQELGESRRTDNLRERNISCANFRGSRRCGGRLVGGRCARAAPSKSRVNLRAAARRPIASMLSASCCRRHQINKPARDPNCGGSVVPDCLRTLLNDHWRVPWNVVAFQVARKAR